MPAGTQHEPRMQLRPAPPHRQDARQDLDHDEGHDRRCHCLVGAGSLRHEAPGTGESGLPPAGPGIAPRNSKPPSPASRARWRHTAFVAPPPADRNCALVSTAASSPSSLNTSASTPSSAANMFEPNPTTTTSSSSLSAKRRASVRSSSVFGRARAAAGPPVPIVVRRASGTPCSISVTSRAALRRSRVRSATAHRHRASRRRRRASPSSTRARPRRPGSEPTLCEPPGGRSRGRPCR